MDAFFGQLLVMALFTLHYGGLATVAFGAVLWGTASKSTERSQRGVWMMYCGGFMLAVYFGWSSFMSMIHYFFEVGTV